jgi:dolichol-phosphate mannosyltransferase
MQKILVSIIMPALNEENNILAAIKNTLKSFDALGIEGEIIVINDGSTDRTKDNVTDAIKKENRLKLINHNTPHGVGASFWEGVDKASGEMVTMLPGDNEVHAQEILRYYKLLDHVDIIIPFVFNKEVRSIYRKLLSSVYRLIINCTFCVSLNYTNGTVLYRKSILQQLNYRNTGFFFQTDILIRTIKQGHLFAEVPYRLNLRTFGNSKAITFYSLLQVVKGYIRLVKGIYFNINGHKKKDFAKDSLTEKRRGGLA